MDVKWDRKSARAAEPRALDETGKKREIRGLKRRDAG